VNILALGQISIAPSEDDTIYFRNEALLDSDVFNKPMYRTNLEALAQVIQNLLIYEPGTFPNDPELGVGIADYMFELADDITLRQISDNIENQIKTYVAHPGTNVNVDVKNYNTTDRNLNTLIINVEVVPIQGQLTDEERIQLSLAATLNTKNKKFISQLIY